MPRFCCYVATPFLLALVVGCSGEPQRPAVYPVTGQVLFDGRPAAGAVVSFHAKGTTGQFPTPSAKADGRGNFTLTTYQAEDGAPQGDYVVTVELRPFITKNGEVEQGPNQLPPKYSSPKTTTVVASVTEGENKVPIKITR
jgi:hypothetical protein